MTSSNRIDIAALAKDIREGNRAALARAITLIESRRTDHQAAARELVQTLLPSTGSAITYLEGDLETLDSFLNCAVAQGIFYGFAFHGTMLYG
jgi:hypothetical protein